MAGAYASAGTSSIGGAKGVGYRARVPRHTTEIVELFSRQGRVLIRNALNRTDAHSLLACNGRMLLPAARVSMLFGEFFPPPEQTVTTLDQPNRPAIP